jgi:hypothetical protein
VLFWYDNPELPFDDLPHSTHYLAHLVQTPEIIRPIPFDRHLGNLIPTDPGHSQSRLSHALLKAYVILGRISEHVNTPNSDPEPQRKEFNELDSHIILFRLSLPRSSTSVVSAPAADQPSVVWLVAILNTLIILLHHRTISHNNSSSVPLTTDEDGFAHCTAAARNIIQLVKDASRISIELLLNPHIAPMLYLAGRILILEWTNTRDESIRSDIDILLLVFDRLSETFAALGKKFRRGVLHDLDLDPVTAWKIKAAGSKGLMTEASQWCVNFMQGAVV